jgi:hypothetical protein
MARFVMQRPSCHYKNKLNNNNSKVEEDSNE